MLTRKAHRAYFPNRLQTSQNEFLADSRLLLWSNILARCSFRFAQLTQNLRCTERHQNQPLPAVCRQDSMPHQTNQVFQPAQHLGFGKRGIIKTQQAKVCTIAYCVSSHYCPGSSEEK